MKKQKEDSQKNNRKISLKNRLTAFFYDRDKHKSYELQDESIDEVVSDEGFVSVVHPNRLVNRNSQSK